MFAIARNPKKRRGASFAYAIALMCGTALGVTALEAPAHAQKKKKNNKDDEAPKADYSKGFVAAYTPVNQLLVGEQSNPSAARGQVDQLIAAIETADDRNAAGGLLVNIGRMLDDTALQLRGLNMMIESGRNSGDTLGRYQFSAYQFNRQLGNFDAARSALEAAIALDYSFEGRLSDGSTRTFGADDLRGMMSELYFEQEDYAGGLAYLENMINERADAGLTVDDEWIRRGFSVAYNQQLSDQAVKFGNLYVEAEPSAERWGDAIAVQRTFFDYGNNEILDLMRLGQRTGSLRNTRDYVDYIEAADPRRLPGEVKRAVDAGIASGHLVADDVFVAEARQISNQRISADRADLPSLERDARAASSTAIQASAAGDVFLSYDQPAKAEEMYKIALGKPGIDTARVLTRLGIAQADQGKTAEAIATFEQVQGARAMIANLWKLYAQSNATPTPAVPAETAAATPAG